MFESDRNSKICKDGEGWSCGAQRSSSEGSKGPGAFGVGLTTDRVPRLDGEALGAMHGGEGGGAAKRQGQLVAQNHALDTGKVGGEGVAEGLQIREGRQGDGFKNKLVY